MYVFTCIIISVVSICFGYFYLPKIVDKCKNMQCSIIPKKIDNDTIELILIEIADKVIELSKKECNDVFNYYNDKESRVINLSKIVLEELDTEIDTETLDYISKHRDLVDYVKNVIDSNYSDLIKSSQEYIDELVEKVTPIDELYVGENAKKNVNVDFIDLTNTINNFYDEN